MKFKETLTYDDVLLIPQYSDKKSRKASIAIITHKNIEKNYNNLLLNLTRNKFVFEKPTFIRIEKV